MASDMATGGGSAETSPLLGRSVAGSEYGGIGSCEADGGAGAGLRRAGRADYGRMFLHNGSTNVRSQFKTFAGLKSSLSSGFYALAYMPSGKCLTTMVGIYVCIIFFYGVIWTAIGVICPECNLEIHNLLEGCLFSLE